MLAQYSLYSAICCNSDCIIIIYTHYIDLFQKLGIELHELETMLKAYKYRLYPTEKQQQHFVQAMGCVRYLYNKGLELKNKQYQETGKSLSCFDLIGGLLKEEKKKNGWLKTPYSQSLQMPFRNLDNAFQNFFRKKTDFPVFKKRNNTGTIQYPQNVKVDFKSGLCIIPKAGKVHTRFDRKFSGKIKTCTVSKTPTDKYFISILVEDDQELPPKQLITSETTIGIDLGLKNFAITSNGEVIANPKYLRNLLDRIKVLQQRASNKQKGSESRKKANKKVAKLYEVISNLRKDFLHKLSTRIISENQTIILETLNVAGMLKNHKLALSISDVSWSEFVRQLEYKAEWNGKNIIRIGRFEPSSNMCFCCGHKNSELKLSDRVWTCSNCHTELDRDLNAAINIKNFGLAKATHAGSVRSEELVEMPGRNQDRRSKKPKVVAVHF